MRTWVTWLANTGEVGAGRKPLLFYQEEKAAVGALCYWPLRRRLSWEYCEVTGLADSGEVDAVRRPLLLNQEEESAVGAVCYWPLRMRLSWEYCAVQLCSGMSRPWCTPSHPFPILWFIGWHISKWWTR